ncbi:MAG TPA: substrate-binding domain-containing protein [Ktedonobacterales bacterium]|nr:substrate-binding domain-containing protein [Ktedonobacterales bacterium]
MGFDGKGSGPLYQQLRQELVARIRRGEFAPGDLLPSENQLCEEYGISVTTARRALLELVNEGVVQRRIGIGTMVAPRVRAAHLAFVSINDFGDAWHFISSAMGDLVAGIGEFAWQRDVSFTMSGITEEHALDHLRALVDNRTADGILLRTAEDIREDNIALLEKARIPYVVIKRQLAGHAINCVVSDDFLGAQIATNHLVQCGHRRIGFVCAKPALTLTQDRLAGYRDALAAAGIAFDERLVTIEPSFRDDMGYRGVYSLLQLPDRPTALFVASDTMSIGGYQAARELGLEIPGDVAFVGYDDIAPAALLQPPLTTIRTSYYEFGRKATQLLLNLIDGQTVAPQRVTIIPELIIRGSTGVAGEAPRPVAVPQAATSSANIAALAVVGRHKKSTEAVAAMLEESGASLVTPAWRALDDHSVTSAVCVADLNRDIEATLATLQEDAESVARALARQFGGKLVIVALSSRQQRDTLTATIARAGLEHLTGTLASRWASSGVRINALFVVPTDIWLITGPCQFLLSEASASITGQMLTIGDPQDAGRRESTSS